MSNSSNWVHIEIIYNICDALRGLVPLAQFKKREKHPRRRDTFSKVRFLNWFLYDRDYSHETVKGLNTYFLSTFNLFSIVSLSVSSLSSRLCRISFNS